MKANAGTPVLATKFQARAVVQGHEGRVSKETEWMSR